MNHFKLIAQFEAGEDVPEWLISVDPTSSDSEKGRAIFHQPVAILESEKCFHVVPLNQTETIIRFTDWRDAEVNAATKDVALNVNWNVLHVNIS
jgi:hypothetical protein